MLSGRHFIRLAQESSAIPYDVPSVELTHVGSLCSFDAFLAKYALKEPALLQLAAIVRGAGTSRLDLTPQSAGVYAISFRTFFRRRCRSGYRNSVRLRTERCQMCRYCNHFITEGGAMSDDLNNRGSQDRSKIAMKEPHEVQYWTAALGISKEELQRVIDKVGNNANAVRKELGKT